MKESLKHQRLTKRKRIKTSEMTNAVKRSRFQIPEVDKSTGIDWAAVDREESGGEVCQISSKEASVAGE